MYPQNGNQHPQEEATTAATGGNPRGIRAATGTSHAASQPVQEPAAQTRPTNQREPAMPRTGAQLLFLFLRYEGLFAICLFLRYVL